MFSAQSGRSIALLFAAAQSETELVKAFRKRFLMASGEEARAILEGGMHEGVLRSSLELETALDIVYAPLYFLLLIDHQPIDAAFVDRLLDGALHGLIGKATER